MTTVSAYQVGISVAYTNVQPLISRSPCWTYVLDGHRFYVLSLGQEGDWQYDTTTHEWSQLQTQGFDGINFSHGTMWGNRVMGGDRLYAQLLELDPNQAYDNEFRLIPHIVTGGIPTRARNAIGVANFTLTASVGDTASTTIPMSLAFSDDNGVTYSPEFTLALTDVSTQTLIWSALGSFSAPGRIFRVTDYSGPVRIDGADCVLIEGDGVDSGQDQEGRRR